MNGFIVVFLWGMSTRTCLIVARDGEDAQNLVMDTMREYGNVQIIGVNPLPRGIYMMAEKFDLEKK